VRRAMSCDAIGCSAVVSQRLRLITRVPTPRSHAILHATPLSPTADKRFLRLNSPLERRSSAPS
jgi:hypothetical protein